jgi:hypothetical protein
VSGQLLKTGVIGWNIRRKDASGASLHELKVSCCDVAASLLGSTGRGDAERSGGSAEIWGTATDAATQGERRKERS